MNEIVQEILIGAAGDGTGGLLAGMITSVSTRIAKRFQPEPQKKALQQALEVSLLTAFETLQDETKPFSRYYLNCTADFLRQRVVQEELSVLLEPSGAFDLNLLRHQFTLATQGYTPEEIPDIDFDVFMQTLMEAFYEAVKRLPDLQQVIQIERLDTLVQLSTENLRVNRATANNTERLVKLVELILKEVLRLQTQPNNDFNKYELVELGEWSNDTATSIYLPPKMYPKFVGRLDEIEDALNALRDPTQKPVTAIWGFGGIGKTALARELTERGTQEQLFDHIVWISYKNEHFMSEKIYRTEAVPSNFDDLLNDIGRQCFLSNITKMPFSQKRTAIRNLLSKKRILVVLDNLETLANEDKLIIELSQVLGQSKILTTSRHQSKYEQANPIRLKGLSEEAGISFLREYGKHRKIQEIESAEISILMEVYHKCGGAPLAMGLIVGQVSRQPIDIVLEALGQASFHEQDYEFYRFIYQYSWNMLSLNSKKVLVEMSIFPTMTGGTVDKVQEISQVKKGDFWIAMEQLIIFSLVDKTGKIGQERFALHPLTQYFVKSDIVKAWD